MRFCPHWGWMVGFWRPLLYLTLSEHRAFILPSIWLERNFSKIRHCLNPFLKKYSSWREVFLFFAFGRFRRFGVWVQQRFAMVAHRCTQIGPRAHKSTIFQKIRHCLNLFFEKQCSWREVFLLFGFLALSSIRGIISIVFSNVGAQVCPNWPKSP